MFVDLTKEKPVMNTQTAEEQPKYRGNYEFDHSRTQICPHCGQSVTRGADFCTHCGSSMTESASAGNTSQVPAFSTPAASNSGEGIWNKLKKVLTDITGGLLDMISELNRTIRAREKNKWISLLLCIFTVFGHKLYEGKIEMAIIYLLTGGLFGIGLVVDVITLLGKPENYYVTQS